ncbi:hypothetical protein AND4_08787 [Vibrio sp. AND4]|nr:hypothetical protein AND4_08787 [Vibrio sp. AND4]
MATRVAMIIETRKAHPEQKLTAWLVYGR